MERKRREYFAAGTSLVWCFDLKAQTVSVHDKEGHAFVLDASGNLDGGEVLPGLVTPLGDLFQRVCRCRGAVS